MAQYSGGFDGMQYNAGGNMEATPPKVPPPNYYAGGGNEGAPAILKTIALVIRGVAILLTLTSTAVMGAAKETVTFPYRDPVNDVYLGNVSLVTKSTQSAAFVYFLVVNPLVFAYSVGSLVTSILRRAAAAAGSLEFLLTIGDVVMVALLFSANGAAVAITVVLENGQQSLAGWDKICDSYGGFCSRVIAAVVLSTMTATLYVLLAVLGAVVLRRSN